MKQELKEIRELRGVQCFNPVIMGLTVSFETIEDILKRLGE